MIWFCMPLSEYVETYFIGYVKGYFSCSETPTTYNTLDMIFECVKIGYICTMLVSV